MLAVRPRVLMLMTPLQFSFGSCLSAPLCSCEDQFPRSSLHDPSYQSHLQMANTGQCTGTVCTYLLIDRIVADLNKGTSHPPQTRERPYTLKPSICRPSLKSKPSTTIPLTPSHPFVSPHTQPGMFSEPPCS